MISKDFNKFLSDKQFNSFKDLIEKQLFRAAELSSFYKNKFRFAGFDAKEGLGEFSLLPLTDKNELLKDQNATAPFGTNLCVEDSEIRRIHKTWGTSIQPLYILHTENDLDEIYSIGSECFRTAGIGEDHRVIHCLNYNMWSGGVTDHLSIERAGASVIPYGVGKSKKLIDVINELNVNAISASTTYMEKLEQTIRAEFSFDPSELGLKMGLLGTDTGLQKSEVRENIEKTWGIDAVFSNFGVAEIMSVFGSESLKKQGLNFIAGDSLYPEIINPVSLKPLPIEKGASGELVLTSLKKEAQPLLRYRTKFLIEIIGEADTKAGMFRFNVTGRSDDVLVVKGLEIYPEQIRTLINNHPDILTGNFQVLLEEPPPLDELYLLIEVADGVSLAEKADIKVQLRKEFRELYSIHPVVDFLDEGELAEDIKKSGVIKKLY